MKHVSASLDTASRDFQSFPFSTAIPDMSFGTFVDQLQTLQYTSESELNVVQRLQLAADVNVHLFSSMRTSRGRLIYSDWDFLAADGV